MTATESDARITVADVDDLLDALASVYHLPPAALGSWDARRDLLAARAQHVRGLLGCRRRTGDDVRALTARIRRLHTEPDLAVRYETREASE
ncbi:hypothetical protein [Nocardiopsis sp. NRRL B-16309]|uniref:hypothetical protein n=1 Tax=Nocardiopsis sp. NRRL B-16309 TaxID=1519494 RepID=UPI0006AE3E79|nr:hypothetical protein [Nocardiopsis sp. NRRL B-16309]KOX13868.1 hypothetical protein ADL05_18150 [Nocardiopsis sp. NRRL B-16309]